MTENKKSLEPKDYKERFEFELTVEGNLICQRYFKIANFNPASLRSYELTDAVRRCAAMIDNDFKDKTHVYLDHYAPQIFSTEEEMEKYLSNPVNQERLHLGQGIVVRENTESDYTLAKDGTGKILNHKFDDGEMSIAPLEENRVTCRLTFKVDERECCTVEWDGYYPKFVRSKIDITNHKEVFDEEVSSMSFKRYLLYSIFRDRPDLVYGIIKTICRACSYDTEDYTTDTDYIMEDWNETSRAIMFHIGTTL